MTIDSGADKNQVTKTDNASPSSSSTPELQTAATPQPQVETPLPTNKPSLLTKFFHRKNSNAHGSAKPSHSSSTSSSSAQSPQVIVGMETTAHDAHEKNSETSLSSLGLVSFDTTARAGDHSVFVSTENHGFGNHLGQKFLLKKQKLRKRSAAVGMTLEKMRRRRLREQRSLPTDIDKFDERQSPQFEGKVIPGSEVSLNDEEYEVHMNNGSQNNIAAVHRQKQYAPVVRPYSLSNVASSPANPNHIEHALADRPKSVSILKNDGGHRQKKQDTSHRKSITYLGLSLLNRKDHLKLENRTSETRGDSAESRREKKLLTRSKSQPASLLATHQPARKNIEDNDENSSRAIRSTVLISDAALSGVLSSKTLVEFLKSKSTTRKFWMPDSSVSTCYECQSSFTVLKRKHHCRICGQIFCWQCSNNFFDGNLIGVSGKVRVCTFCVKLVLGVDLDALELQDAKKSLSKTSKDYLSMVFDEMPDESAEEFDDDDEQANSDNNEFDDDANDEMVVVNAMQGPDYQRNSVDITRSGERKVLMDMEPNVVGDEQVQEVTVGQKFEEQGIRDVHADTPESRRSSIFSMSGSEFENNFDDHLHSIEDAAFVHLKAIVRQVLTKEQLDLEWQDIIVGLALRVVNDIVSNPLRNDKMDIRHYVKIKKAPGGTKFDTEFVDGVMFRKNVVHKKMTTNMDDVPLLLLGCPIEYNRHENQLSSFDILMKQEFDVLKMQVARIADCKPKVVFVEKSVSRLAQDLIQDQNISLVVNIKRSVMERLSRISGVNILNTIEQIDQHAIGKSPQMFVKRFRGKWGSKTLLGLRAHDITADCTILLRGDNKAELKKIKNITRFAIFVANNLKLETEYFFDQCGTLIYENRTGSTMQTEQEATENGEEFSDDGRKMITSASPHVHFPLRLNTLPPMSTISDVENKAKRESKKRKGKKGKDHTDDEAEEMLHSNSKKETGSRRSNLNSQILNPRKHQNIVLLFTKYARKVHAGSTTGPHHASGGNNKTVEFAQATDFVTPEIIVIAYYTENDMSLGQFLETKCFGENALREFMHVKRCFMHENGRITITIDKNPLVDHMNDSTIVTWNFCKACGRVVTPAVPMSENSLKYSFGKMLETTYYNHSLRCRTGGCNHSIHRDHIRCYAFGNVVAKIEYDHINVYDIATPPQQITYDDKIQSDKFQHVWLDVADASTKAFSDIRMLLTEMIDDTRLDDQREHISHMLRSVDIQKGAMLDEFKSVEKTVSIYRINDFIRRVNVALVAHTKMIRDLVYTPHSSPSTPRTSTESTVAHQKQKLMIQHKRTRSRDERVRFAPSPHIHVSLMDHGSDHISVVLETNPSHHEQLVVSTQRSLRGATATDVPTSGTASISTETPHGNETDIDDQEEQSETASDDGMYAHVDEDDDERSDSDFRSDTSGREQTHPRPLKLQKQLIVNGNSTSAKKRFQQVTLPKILDDDTNALFLPMNGEKTIIVRDSEPSTIIAYMLASAEYKEFIAQENGTLNKKHELERVLTLKDKTHFKFKYDGSSIDLPHSTIGGVDAPSNSASNKAKKKRVLNCTAFYARQFSALREICTKGDEKFIHSLSKCAAFKPTGGRSKSTFVKTWDDRYIMKDVSRVELAAFLDIGPAYFEHMANALFHELPTVLAKTVGVFRLSYHNYEKGKTMKQDFVIMENVLYNRSPLYTFDLKGSTRNRYQTKKGSVMQDENMLESISGGSHLATREMSKALLKMSIHNDTLFLSKLNIMDYSLLVGVDNEKMQLVVGIIDYIRTYTWDKQLETWYKSAGIISNKTKIPTVISPKYYKRRFRDAMDNYVLMTPCKFTGLPTTM